MNLIKLLSDHLASNTKRLLNEDPYRDTQHMKSHAEKHKSQIDPALTDDEFDIYGDYLYEAPIDNKNVFGFISCSDGVYGIAKYDKKNRLFIVYDFDENEKPFTRTTMRFGMGRYLQIKEKNYVGEVPSGL